MSSNSNDPAKPTSFSQITKAKITALGHLRSFGENLTSQRKIPPIVFPPPSWELNDELLGKPPALTESNYAPVDHPEPVSFAQRIRSLIELLPLPGTVNPSAASRPQTVTDLGTDYGKSGSPVPSGMDEHLVRMLSSEDVMNGKRSDPALSAGGDKEEDRPGVWNILATLKNGNKPESQPNVKSRRSTVEEGEDGIMMYAPLEPKSDSQVELATSETILEYVDEPESNASSSSITKPNVSGKSTIVPSVGPSVKEHVVEKHVWVPSTTQLSLLTTWWGYRLYLPPPVMEKLSSTSIEATARAAMITTALKWLLDKIPIMLVPPQFRPALKMLKQLGPVAGYVGIFIAWSWDRVKACDKGNGVVLTATWLLPVALIPMSWDAGDIYGPRPPPSAEEIAAAQAERDKEEEENRKKKEEEEQQNKKKSIFRW